MQSILKIKKKDNATVCILTSGIGSRLEEYTKDVNKALLVIEKKSALSHIIDNFPKNSNYIIAIGYKGELIKDFIKIHHPDINVKFVNVLNFNNKGSGPGTSLLKCKKYLQKEFFFVSCDTLWKKKIFNKKKYNWMGVTKVISKNMEMYCNLQAKNDLVSKFYDKKRVKNLSNLKTFVGLGFIKDFRIFWDGFKKNDKKQTEVQVIKGFENLVNNSVVKTINIDWSDIGTKINYEKLIKKTEKFNFSKLSQKVFISEKKVTKFFLDKKIIKKLYLKTKFNQKIFPNKVQFKKNFLSYDFENGKTLYNYYNLKYFKKFLLFLEKNLWIKRKKLNKKFINDCKIFYYNKTQSRIKKIFEKYPNLEKKNYIVNSQKVDSIKSIMKKIPWKDIFLGNQTKIHGDLQFDNIIYSKSKKFVLIDWRHQFGKNIFWGDLYYDYAKLLGGLEINYDFIKKNKFLINIQGNSIYLKSKKRPNKNLLINSLLKHAKRNKLNTSKIRIITGIIFLNMSPLHKAPFDKFLFYYGKYYLQKYLNDKLY